MHEDDTIVAISSAIGASARIVLRMTGGGCAGVLRKLLAPVEADWVLSAGVGLRHIWPDVDCLIHSFVAPKSYTGGDLIELHLPGSPVLARMILERMVKLGARHALPGEFTARAYFNGRMDLTQAEGVAATIAAQNQQELGAARQLLAGELARRLAPIMDQIATTLALVEVGIDFSDEDVTFLSSDQVIGNCNGAIRAMMELMGQSARFERLKHEPRIVLVGRPNAGKSTLLNALVNNQRAVVSDQAGTTRDALVATVALRRGLVQLVDVAGIEMGAVAGSGELSDINRQMQAQAKREVEGADFVLLVEAAGDAAPRLELDRNFDAVIRSKFDLHEVVETSKWEVSAQTGAGMDALRSALDELVFGSAAVGGDLTLNARHVGFLQEAEQAVRRAVESVEVGSELVALELREALECLGGILGRLSPDDLLGKIFGQFCIGK